MPFYRNHFQLSLQKVTFNHSYKIRGKDTTHIELHQGASYSFGGVLSSGNLLVPFSGSFNKFSIFATRSGKLASFDEAFYVSLT